jgi:hypothetical protein
MELMGELGRDSYALMMDGVTVSSILYEGGC